MNGYLLFVFVHVCWKLLHHASGLRSLETCEKSGEKAFKKGFRLAIYKEDNCDYR